MIDCFTMYERIGISKEVYDYGEGVLKELAPRFLKIDEMAEYNQAKVLNALQKSHRPCVRVLNTL